MSVLRGNRRTLELESTLGHGFDLPQRPDAQGNTGGRMTRSVSRLVFVQRQPGLGPAAPGDLQHRASPTGQLAGPRLAQALMQHGDPGEPELLLLHQLRQAAVDTVRCGAPVRRPAAACQSTKREVARPRPYAPRFRGLLTWLNAAGRGCAHLGD